MYLFFLEKLEAIKRPKLVWGWLFIFLKLLLNSYFDFFTALLKPATGVTVKSWDRYYIVIRLFWFYSDLLLHFLEFKQLLTEVFGYIDRFSSHLLWVYIAFILLIALRCSDVLCRDLIWWLYNSRACYFDFLYFLIDFRLLNAEPSQLYDGLFIGCHVDWRAFLSPRHLLLRTTADNRACHCCTVLVNGSHHYHIFVIIAFTLSACFSVVLFMLLLNQITYASVSCSRQSHTWANAHTASMCIHLLLWRAVQWRLEFEGPAWLQPNF